MAPRDQPLLASKNRSPDRGGLRLDCPYRSARFGSQVRDVLHASRPVGGMDQHSTLTPTVTNRMVARPRDFRAVKARAELGSVLSESGRRQRTFMRIAPAWEDPSVRRRR